MRFQKIPGRLVLLIFAGSLVLPILAGCGGSNEETGPGNGGGAVYYNGPMKSKGEAAKAKGAAGGAATSGAGAGQ